MKQSPKDANLIKYGLIKEVNFTIILLKNGIEMLLKIKKMVLKIMILKCIQYIMKENQLLLKDLLEY